MAKKKELSKTAVSAPIYDAAQPVFVVGGGASLKDFDWSLLAGKQVLAVNTAYRKLPGAQAMFFGDSKFYEQWKDSLHPKQDFWRFKGRIFTSAEGFADHPRIETVSGLPAVNSGAQAIALAQMLGAEKVVLLGFDGKPGHWHDGTTEAHQHAGPEAEAYIRYCEEFADISGDVVNCSPDSAIITFPIEQLSNHLKGA